MIYLIYLQQYCASHWRNLAIKNSKNSSTCYSIRASPDILSGIAFVHSCPNVCQKKKMPQKNVERLCEACLPLSRIPDHCPDPSSTVYKVPSTFSTLPHPPFHPYTHSPRRTQNTVFELRRRKRAACETRAWTPSDPLTRIGERFSS